MLKNIITPKLMQYLKWWIDSWIRLIDSKLMILKQTYYVPQFKIMRLRDWIQRDAGAKHYLKQRELSSNDIVQGDATRKYPIAAENPPLQLVAGIKFATKSFVVIEIAVEIYSPRAGNKFATKSYVIIEVVAEMYSCRDRLQSTFLGADYGVTV